MRGAKPIQLKTQVDATLELGKANKDFEVESVIVFRRLAGECPMVDGRDTWWHDEMSTVDANCDCEWMESEAEPPPIHTTMTRLAPYLVCCTVPPRVKHSTHLFKPGLLSLA